MDQQPSPQQIVHRLLKNNVQEVLSTLRNTTLASLLEALGRPVPKLKHERIQDILNTPGWDSALGTIYASYKRDRERPTLEDSIVEAGIPHCIYKTTRPELLVRAQCLFCERRVVPNQPPYLAHDICFKCVLDRQNPFVCVRKTLAGPAVVVSSMPVTFTLPEAEYNFVRQYRVVLRCFPIQRKTGGADARFPIYPGHELPIRTHVVFNDTLLPTYVQREQKGGEPIDLTGLVRLGINRITFIYPENDGVVHRPAYVVAVQAVACYGANRLLDEISAKPRYTKEDTIRILRSRLGGGGGDDDDVVADPFIHVSLLCPISKVTMKIPARGRFCTHLQCFDLQTFLEMHQRRPWKMWRCAVCNETVGDMDGVCADDFFCEILEELASRRSAAEVHRIVLDEHGNWQTS